MNQVEGDKLGFERETKVTLYPWQMEKLQFAHVDAEQRGHPVEVIGVVGHSQDFGDDGVLGPLGSELLNKLGEVTGGCFTDGVH